MHILFLRTAWCLSALLAVMPLATKAMAGGSDDESEQPSGARAAATPVTRGGGACASKAIDPLSEDGAGEVRSPREEALHDWAQHVRTHLQTARSEDFRASPFGEFLQHNYRFSTPGSFSAWTGSCSPWTFINRLSEEPFLDRLSERIRTSNVSDIPFNESTRMFNREKISELTWHETLKEVAITAILESIPQEGECNESILACLIPTQHQLAQLTEAIRRYYSPVYHGFLTIEDWLESTVERGEPSYLATHSAEQLDKTKEIPQRLRAWLGMADPSDSPDEDDEDW